MKQVTMVRALRPYGAGDTAVLPDEVADKLIKDGAASDPRPFPPPDVAPAVPVSTDKKPPARRGYFTRNGKSEAKR